MEETEKAKSGIPEITKSIPTIEAQFRDAFTIKKRGFYPSMLDRLSIKFVHYLSTFLSHIFMVALPTKIVLLASNNIQFQNYFA